MPELPEVETIRRDLSVCINDTIIQQIVCRKNVFRGKIPDLTDLHIQNIYRKGKLLQFHLSDNYWLLAHLKMTGKFILETDEEILDSGYSRTETAPSYPTKHTALCILFTSGNTLYFDDIRKFGYLDYVDSKKRIEINDRYGIEPGTASFTKSAFHDIFKRRTTTVKSLLLNQKVIAGLGNIYVDEVCFAAMIRPDRRVNTLTKKEKDRLYTVIEPILTAAIEKRGTTFRNYVDAAGNTGGYEQQLQVYGKEEEPCPNCKGAIQKIRVAGRGTHICVNCQK